MKIYRMTAIFGKLEHQTLELKPGLNVITAPNEWGKSTWCAFLMAMFYGIDTREKSTQKSLAEKDRYAPWSGSPMSGRIDLNWNGRDITIERKTRRRVPMGEFQAYETETGITVPELTAANCGAVLLGVEQSVFRRAGFIRHADLPVTQDEALRRRLNALVTTGDDSGAADRLAASLKELKNRCRYNRSGLLPQAEAQRDALESKLTELESLDIQIARLRERLEEIENMLVQLHNHRQTMAYAKMEADIARVEKAKTALEQIETDLRTLEEACAQLPAREETQVKTRELRAFREQWAAIQAELQTAPAEPAEPRLPDPFTGLTLETARSMVREDADNYAAMVKTKAPAILIAVGIFGIAAAVGLVFLMANLFAAVSGVAGIVAFIWGIYEKISMKKQTKALLEKYGTENWKQWSLPLETYAQAMEVYRRERKEYLEISSDLEVRLMVLRNKRDSLCGIQEPEVLLEYWQNALEQWDKYDLLCRDAARAKEHFEVLQAMVKPVEKPAMADRLSHSEEETTQLLSDCAMEQQRLQNRLGQYQGRMELLGDRDVLRRQLDKTQNRIADLEDTYTALLIAQETLAAAKEELQRRFAPRITRQAQKLLSQMTDGRYHSLIMGKDFSLQAAAGAEDTVCDALWRSDGTMDQLYLALRLAVSEELTPEAPLVLDDVLVRFDDKRMKAAVRLLREMAKDKQILLFTCQGREEEA